MCGSGIVLVVVTYKRRLILGFGLLFVCRRLMRYSHHTRFICLCLFLKQYTLNHIMNFVRAETAFKSNTHCTVYTHTILASLKRSHVCVSLLLFPFSVQISSSIVREIHLQTTHTTWRLICRYQYTYVYMCRL